MFRIRWLSVAVAGLVAFGVTGCANPPIPHSPAPTSPPSVDTAADSPTGDIPGFYAQLSPGEGALLRQDPATLKDAVEESTLVLQGEIADVRPGRTIGDLHMVKVRVEVKAVIRGSVPFSDGSVVQVEFPGVVEPDSVEPMVRSLNEGIPEEAAVWLLRWQGEPPVSTKAGGPKRNPVADPRYYSVTHPNVGVLVNTAGGVRSAVGPSSVAHNGTTARREAEGFANLTTLTKWIRGIDPA